MGHKRDGKVQNDTNYNIFEFIIELKSFLQVISLLHTSKPRIILTYSKQTNTAGLYKLNQHYENTPI